MYLSDHTLHDGDLLIELPRLPHAAKVRVWRVPAEYRANGLFVAVTGPGDPPEIPACNHGLPEVVAELPADPGAEAAAEMEAAARTATAAIQELLDSTARRYEYDNINNVTGWAGEFPEATALKAWAATCWRKSGEIRAAVLAGERAMPTVPELLAELPVFEL